ncbi:MAG: hypothetical protein ACREJC_05030, partial [Tepidisphaeraceae bacterium]
VSGACDDGTYSLWIDPSRDWALVRAGVIREGSQRIWGKPLNDAQHGLTTQQIEHAQLNLPAPRTKFRFVAGDAKLEQIQGRWAVISARFETDMTFGDGVSSRSVDTLERKLTFDPDFAKTEAFKPDAPDGTRVLFPGKNEKHFVWWNGLVLPVENGLVTDKPQEDPPKK